MDRFIGIAIFHNEFVYCYVHLAEGGRKFSHRAHGLASLFLGLINSIRCEFYLKECALNPIKSGW